MVMDPFENTIKSYMSTPYENARVNLSVRAHTHTHAFLFKFQGYCGHFPQTPGVHGSPGHNCWPSPIHISMFSPCGLAAPQGQGSALLCSLLHPWHLEQHSASKRHSVSTCGMKCEATWFDTSLPLHLFFLVGMTESLLHF